MSTNQAAVAAKKGYSTKELVLDAMFIALTYVFTAFVNVRLPIAANGGLIHLGNVPLFICAILKHFWSSNTGTKFWFNAFPIRSLPLRGVANE